MDVDQRVGVHGTHGFPSARGLGKRPFDEEMAVWRDTGGTRVSTRVCLGF